MKSVAAHSSVEVVDALSRASDALRASKVRLCPPWTRWGASLGFLLSLVRPSTEPKSRSMSAAPCGLRQACVCARHLPVVRSCPPTPCCVQVQADCLFEEHDVRRSGRLSAAELPGYLMRLVPHLSQTGLRCACSQRALHPGPA